MLLMLVTKIRERLFLGKTGAIFLLVCLGPCFCLLLGAIGLAPYNPWQAGLLARGLLLLYFFWVSSLLTTLLWVGMVVESICLYSWGIVGSMLWHFSFHLSLLISYLVMEEIRKILATNDHTILDQKKELDLWKVRFDTLHEKMREDQKVWEEEIQMREEQLKSTEEVQREKLKRTETLLGTSRKKAISLETIAKGVKRESKK
jgi:hypothetical protein